MKVAVIGATGRTGRPLVEELLRRGHQVTVLVRSPEKVGSMGGRVKVVSGESTDAAALHQLLRGVDSVASALGPSEKQSTLHRDTAVALISAMRERGVRRFVGINGAGIDVIGDEKDFTARIISALIRRVGGDLAKDKAAEYQVWAATDLEWTLVRPPRLTMGKASGRVAHHAHRPPKARSIRRADLAVFIADVLERNGYSRLAPFVAQGQLPSADLPVSRSADSSASAG